MREINSIKGKCNILIDFFDTTVHRKSTPEQIKEEWSKKISNELNYTIFPKVVYRIRHEVEIELESKYGLSYNYEQLMIGIWNRMFDAGCELYDKSQFINKALKIETEIEERYLYIDKDIEILLRNANGKHVYIVSDYHLDSDVISHYMKKLGMAEYVDGYFVSCEYGASKYKGDLYNIVIDKLMCKASNCIMIGDNKISDIERSNQHGIHSIYRPYIAKVSSLSKEHYRAQLKKMINSKDYSGYCFSLALFTERLFVALKKDKIKKVFFLSREGEFLKKLFDLYCKINEEDKIESHYLYVSRQSTFVASLNKDLEKENFHTLFRQFNNISVNTFLKNLNFSEKEIANIINLTEIDVNSVIYNFSESNELKYLKELDAFKQTYEEHVERQKRLFSRYLLQEGYKEDESLCIVDVGWKGTIQDNILNALSEDCIIEGIYLGYGEISEEERVYRSKKKGLLFSVVPYKTTIDGLWSIDAAMFEKILYASHPSTSGYEILEKKIKPIFKSFDEEKGVYQKIMPIQESIYKKCEIIFGLFLNTSFMMEDYEDLLMELHLQSVLTMNHNKLSFRKEVEEKHFENFGTFNTVVVGQKSSNYNIKGNFKYFINRTKKIFDPFYFTFNAYHFSSIKNSLFWCLYSKVVYKRAIKIFRRNNKI